MTDFSKKAGNILSALLFYSLTFFTDNSAISEMIPRNIVSMAKKGDIALVVEKATQTLFIYKYNGAYQLEGKMKCSTGKLPGRKTRSGDQKTPEGVYFFTGRYFEKDLTPVYGAGAFPVDYPNQLDKEAGRTGYSIWLHGTDKKLKPRDSNGCVALENGNIKKIEDRISLDYTPIVFLDRIEYIDAKENVKNIKAIDSLLKGWVNALLTKTYHQYLSFYSPDYVPDISWWRKWQEMKQSFGSSLSVSIQERAIYRDGDLFVILFEEVLETGTIQRRSGVKKLYASVEDGNFKIRGETYKFIHSAVSKNKKKPGYGEHFLASAVKMKNDFERIKIKRINDDVRGLVKKWVKDWRNGNIDEYSEFYSSDFFSSGMDKIKWVDRKKYLNEVYEYIDVRISNLSLKHEDKKILVKFQQQYKSSGYSADGSKVLVLVNEDKRWKIIQETWKKS